MAGDLSTQPKQPRRRDHSSAHDLCGFLYIKTTDIVVYPRSFLKAIEIIVFTFATCFLWKPWRLYCTHGLSILWKKHRDHSFAHDLCGFLYIKTTDIVVYPRSICFFESHRDHSLHFYNLFFCENHRDYIVHMISLFFVKLIEITV